MICARIKILLGFATKEIVQNKKKTSWAWYENDFEQQNHHHNQNFWCCCCWAMPHSNFFIFAEQCHTLEFFIWLENKNNPKRKSNKNIFLTSKWRRPQKWRWPKKWTWPQKWRWPQKYTLDFGSVSDIPLIKDIVTSNAGAWVSNSTLRFFGSSDTMADYTRRWTYNFFLTVFKLYIYLFQKEDTRSWMSPNMNRYVS